jgi:hypothetical protein
MLDFTYFSPKAEERASWPIDVRSGEGRLRLGDSGPARLTLTGPLVPQTGQLFR